MYHAILTQLNAPVDNVYKSSNQRHSGNDKLLTLDCAVPGLAIHNSTKRGENSTKINVKKV